MSPKERKVYSVELTGSHGVDRSAFFGKNGWERIENFRIDSSGALVKRPGRERFSTPELSVTEAIPFVTQNEDGKPFDMLMLTPPYVTALDSETGETARYERDLADDGRDMSLCIFRDRVYLSDANALKYFVPDRRYFLYEQGYAPLYGLAWDPQKRGPVHEEANLLSGRLRINYAVVGAASSLDVGIKIKRVLRVEINGAQTTDFSVSGSLISGNFPEDSSVDVWVECQNEVNLGFASCHFSTVVGSGDGERMVCFGSDVCRPMIYCSRPVSEKELEASRKGFSDSSELYFPASLAVRIGNLGQAVTALCGCNDGFAVFTESGSFYASFEDKSLQCIPISMSIGCAGRRGVMFKNGLIYTVCKHGIYVMDVDFDNPRSTKISRLSDPIAGDADFCIDSGCTVSDNEKDGEIWFGFKESIYIYNLKFCNFFSYSFISSDFIMPHNGYMLLFYGNEIWKFRDDMFYDMIDGAESPFTANARTRWLDLDAPSSLKSGARIATVFDIEGGDRIMLGVETDTGLSKPYQMLHTRQGRPKHLTVRVGRCRFSSLRFAITSYGQSRPKIFNLTVKANSCD